MWQINLKFEEGMQFFPKFSNSFSNRGSGWLLIVTKYSSSVGNAGSGILHQLKLSVLRESNREKAGALTREGFLREERDGSRIKGIATFPQRPESKELTDKCTCEVTKARCDTCSVIWSKTEPIKQVLAKQTVGVEVMCPGHQRVGSP